jgi:hypothetical protein
LASIYVSEGKRGIQVVGEDGKRRQVRLGRVDQRTAEGVERLVASKRSGMPIAADTASWLGVIPDQLHERIAKLDLCESRNKEAKGDMPLRVMLEAYIERRRADLKAWTIIKLEHGRNNLIGFFGEARTIDSITVADAQDFRRHLMLKYSVATVAKFIMVSRQ